MYQRDALSVVSEIYSDFNDILITRRGVNESLKIFLISFVAQAAKFNSIAASKKLPGSLTFLMPLANANIDYVKRATVLAAVLPSGDSLNSHLCNRWLYESCILCFGLLGAPTMRNIQEKKLSS